MKRERRRSRRKKRGPAGKAQLFRSAGEAEMAACPPRGSPPKKSAERKSYAFPASYPYNTGGCAANMFQISRTTPSYYFTAVAHHRLPIFRTDALKRILCDAYAEARERHGILILAYVIMLEHVHLLTYSDRAMEDVLRLMNGVSARRIIQYLQQNNFESSLIKLRGETRNRNHKHSVWHHHTDSLEIFAEATFQQKVDYIHMNPVRPGFVSHPEEYLFSSARQWAGHGQDDEPLLSDHQQID